MKRKEKWNTATVKKKRKTNRWLGLSVDVLLSLAFNVHYACLVVTDICILFPFVCLGD